MRRNQSPRLTSPQGHSYPPPPVRVGKEGTVLDRPAEFINAFEVIERELRPDHLLLLERYASGKSGCAVFRGDIALRHPQYDGACVIKLDCRAGRGANRVNEAAVHTELQQRLPSFTKSHLPRVLASLQSDEASALIMTLAGNSGIDFQPLANVTDSATRPRLARRVGRALLRDWNPEHERSAQQQPPIELLRAWLGHRVGPASRLPARVAGWGSAVSEEWFSWGGRVLPNPVRYATDPAPWPSRQLFTFWGRQHSDLHDLNIVVSRDPSSDDFFFIDLGAYQARQPLFFDSAYLEFSLLARSRAGYSPERWLQFLDAIAERRFCPPPHTDDEGLIALVRAYRAEEDAWMDRNQPGRRDCVRGQRQLARVAVGLNFANKRCAPAEIQRAGLTFAAHHLQGYLHQFGIAPGGHESASRGEE